MDEETTRIRRMNFLLSYCIVHLLTWIGL